MNKYKARSDGKLTERSYRRLHDVTCGHGLLLSLALMAALNVCACAGTAGKKGADGGEVISSPDASCRAECQACGQPDGCGGICTDDMLCDDGNACTVGVCDPGAGCSHLPLAGGQCGAPDLCAGVCMEGECVETAVEICDGEDNSCDGQVDEGFNDNDLDGDKDCVDPDDDNDGSADEVDCAPLEPSVNPKMKETCDNDVDDDCNGLKDGKDPACLVDHKLVLYLPLDDLATGVFEDATGGGHPGTPVNGASVEAGKLGEAASFDGNDDYVRLPDPHTLTHGQARSVSLWFKAPDSWRRRTLYHQEDYRDLNSDGYPDIIFGNLRTLYTYNLDSFIYWGSKEGFSVENRTDLPGHGSTSTSVADLNHDGHLDVLLSNSFNGVSWEIDSYIYWGSPDGFDPDNKSPLPGNGGNGSCVVDLNGDDYWDIVLCCDRDDSSNNVDSYIYWGSPDGFSPDNRLPLPTQGGSACAITDFNRDGEVDLLFSNRRNDITQNTDSYIYWGAEDGFKPDNKSLLPTIGALGNSVADLDANGYQDIIFSNYNDDTTYNVDSYVYWGSEAGFGVDDRTSLPTHGGSADSAADLDGDGYHDIVFTNFFNDVSYVIMSDIYWGSPEGFSVADKTGLPTKGAAGNAVADMNLDGYLDIVWGNNRVGSVTQMVESTIYWGSADGYKADAVSFVPTWTVHGASIAGSPLDAAAKAHGEQPSDYGSFELYLEDGRVVFVFTDYDHRTHELSAEYDSGNWNHVAGAYDGAKGAVSLYVNGQLAELKETPVNMGGTFPWRVRVGSDSENQHRFQGLVDELRVYDRAVSGEEAAFLCEHPSGTVD